MATTTTPGPISPPSAPVNPPTPPQPTPPPQGTDLGQEQQPVQSISYPPFVPPPQQGSTGPGGVSEGPILTPYGGIYPQPRTPLAYSQQQAPGLLDTTSIEIRPLVQTRMICLHMGNVVTGQSGLAVSTILPFQYTIKDILYMVDGSAPGSNVRLGFTQEKISRSILDAGNSPGNLLMPQSISSQYGAINTMIMVTQVIPVYAVNIYVPFVNSILWADFFNAASTNQSAMVVLTIEIEPGSETVP